jgi:AcrR family transcriptional regulator
MSSEERRASILRAATEVFGASGYVGATTDDIARAAGVSQPYIVRLFGSKQALYLEVLQRALDLLLERFRAALPGDPAELGKRVGDAYVELIRERGVHLTLGHAFLLGADPAIGAAARAGWRSVWRFLREEAGMTGQQAQEFLAHGMYLNAILGMRFADDYGVDAEVTEMFDECFPEKAAAIASLAQSHES